MTTVSEKTIELGTKVKDAFKLDESGMPVNAGGNEKATDIIFKSQDKVTKESLATHVAFLGDAFNAFSYATGLQGEEILKANKGAEQVNITLDLGSGIKFDGQYDRNIKVSGGIGKDVERKDVYGNITAKFGLDVVSSKKGEPLKIRELFRERGLEAFGG